MEFPKAIGFLAHLKPVFKSVRIVNWEDVVADEGKEFREPKLTINRVYTKNGDGGKTRLVGGQLIDKHDLRIECYGTVDELNAVVGACVVGAKAANLDELARILTRTQNTHALRA